MDYWNDFVVDLSDEHGDTFRCGAAFETETILRQVNLPVGASRDASHAMKPLSAGDGFLLSQS